MIDLNPHHADAYFNAGILFYNHERQRKQALHYFEQAAKLGHSQAPQIVARIRGELGHPFQVAFEAFQRATSVAQMGAAVAQHPLMVSNEFIGAVAQAIEERVPMEQRVPFEQRLGWLRQIAQQ